MRRTMNTERRSRNGGDGLGVAGTGGDGSGEAVADWLGRARRKNVEVWRSRTGMGRPGGAVLGSAVTAGHGVAQSGQAGSGADWRSRNGRDSPGLFGRGLAVKARRSRIGRDGHGTARRVLAVMDGRGAERDGTASRGGQGKAGRGDALPVVAWIGQPRNALARRSSDWARIGNDLGQVVKLPRFFSETNQHQR